MNDRQRRHEVARRHRFFRRWHRWIGAAAGLFLIFAAITGFLVAFTEFFGPEERLREANRKLTSPITASTPVTDWMPQIGRALQAVTPGSPVDKVIVEFKGEAPRIQIFTGKVGGGEDRKYVVDYKTGRLLATETYADKPFLYRLHSGEAFGDGGLVISMLWGLALALLGLSGMYIWVTTWKKRAKPKSETRSGPAT